MLVNARLYGFVRYAFHREVLAIGLTSQAGATGAVKAVKMSAKLTSGNRQGR